MRELVALIGRQQQVGWGKRFDLVFILHLALILMPIFYLRLIINKHLSDALNSLKKISDKVHNYTGAFLLSKSTRIMKRPILILGFFTVIYNIQSQMNSKQTASKGPLDHFQVPIQLPFTIMQSDCRMSTIYQRDGHWNQKQRLKYSIFICFFKQVLQNPYRKKAIRIYEMMSDMIVTRNPAQCRSHHQKMQKFRNSMEQIVKSVSSKYDPRVYQELEQKYLVLIKVLLQNRQKYTRKPNPRQRSIKSIPILQRVPNSTLSPSNVKDLSLVKELKQVPVKTKQEQRNTADCYNEDQCIIELQNVDQIPIIGINSSKIEDESDEVASRHMHDNILLASHSIYLKTDSSEVQSVKITMSGGQYFEQQMRLLQMKREWHTKNVEQLNLQLMKEKQAIRNCDLTINLCRSALRNSI